MYRDREWTCLNHITSPSYYYWLYSIELLLKWWLTEWMTWISIWRKTTFSYFYCELWLPVGIVNGPSWWFDRICRWSAELVEPFATIIYSCREDRAIEGFRHDFLLCSFHLTNLFPRKIKTKKKGKQFSYCETTRRTKSSLNEWWTSHTHTNWESCSFLHAILYCIIMTML